MEEVSKWHRDGVTGVDQDNTTTKALVGQEIEEEVVVIGTWCVTMVWTSNQLLKVSCR